MLFKVLIKYLLLQPGHFQGHTYDIVSAFQVRTLIFRLLNYQIFTYKKKCYFYAIFLIASVSWRKARKCTIPIFALFCKKKALDL